MTDYIPQWNPLQFIFISVFTCYISFLRLPYGGVSVIAVYLMLLVFCVPALFVQLKLGGYLQKGIVGIFSMYFPIWKGVGIAALIHLLFSLTNFAPIVAQFGTYAFIAISEKPYVWGSCGKIQNARLCYDEDWSADPFNAITDTPRAEELFYKQEFLQLSAGIDSIDGFPQWQFTEIARKAEVSLMPVTLAIVWVLIFLLVGFGGRFCGWVLFVMGPAAVSCLCSVLVYGYMNLDTEAAVKYLQQVYQYNSNFSILKSLVQAFHVVMLSLPVWTAMAATMGKLCGRSRTIRNITWLFLLLIFAIFTQLPPIAMAPYLGTMIYKKSSPGFEFINGPGIVLWQMPAAFTSLEVPPVYSFLFLLSAFLFGLMYLCIGCLTIIDNIMDALEEWIDKKCCSKVVVHLLVTFVVMCIAKGMGILQTTKAGMYYFILIDQALTKLQFILVILMALGFLVVYVKQNFALAERIIMGLWFGLAGIASAGFWFFMFLKVKDLPIHYKDVSTDYKFPVVWETVSWVIAAIPYIGVIIGAVHTLVVAKGPGKLSQCCCGITERVREHTDEEIPMTGYHLPPSEPTAPPYMHTYMENSYPLDDVGFHTKYDYEPPESEPLTACNSTRI